MDGRIFGYGSGRSLEIDKIEGGEGDMKWHAYLTMFVIGVVVLQAGAAAASPSDEHFDALIAQIDKTRSATPQSAYSLQLQKSINAGAVRSLERTCARKHPGARVQTFTLLGIMRLDGVLKAPVPLPDNAFTACIADQIASVSFPLPPGNGNGWPVGMQFDGATGKVLYVAGDKQLAMPQYSRSTPALRQWMYTPVPVIPAGLNKACETSVWLTISAHGHVTEAEMGDSSCPSTLSKAVVDSASQWLNIGVPGSHSADARDVRISFRIENKRIKVKL